MGRLLGLDAGERRIGVAISDPDQRIAVSRSTIERDARGSEFTELRRMVEEDEIVAMIVGLPLSLNGEKGGQAERAEAFARQASETVGRPAIMYDERLSSREATNSGSRNRRDRGRGRLPQVDVDAVAAAIILQAFLDSLNFLDREPGR